MPPTKLNSRRCCNSSAAGWPKTQAAWPPPCHSSPATPPTAWANRAATWSGSPSWSAAATASPSSAHDQAFPGPAEATPRLASGLNVAQPESSQPAGRLLSMATWAQFESEASQLAGMVQARFEAAETHILATLRKDGSPRVSGSEVEFKGPDLSFGSMPNAVKALDLQRDGRCAIHAHPGKDGDAKVAGIAIEVPGEARDADVTGSEPPGDSHAFRLELREAVITAVEGDELVVRFWRPGLGIRTVRRR